MQFVLMFGVMFFFLYHVFCIATISSEVTRILKSKLVPRMLSLRQVVPLITFLYPIMFMLITVTCSGYSDRT
jgi:hypothetical protein